MQVYKRSNSPSWSKEAAIARSASLVRKPFRLLFPFLPLLLAAFALRAWDFGNPVLDLDEQWYLLVGDRLLRGAVPFIDLWDRKPVGLFLLFAAIRSLPGDGVVAYQVAATLSAGVTAALIAIIARRSGVGLRACTVAGLLYLLSASVIGGQGGQAPIFYNLLVAFSVLLTTRLPALTRRNGLTPILVNGVVACGVLGAAILMKYTAAIEGAFIGLAHLWTLRRAGRSWGETAICGVPLALAGLAPTLIAVGAYYIRGPEAFRAFWFANFVSIGLRRSYPAAQAIANLGSIAGQISPLIITAAFSIAKYARPLRANPLRLITAGWLAAALVGFACIGTFHDHYALPLLAPLAVVASPALDRSKVLQAGMLLVSLAIYAGEWLSRPYDAVAARQVAALVKRVSGTECPYVFMGDPITYYLADSCIPTAYAFPNSLAQRIEQGSTGIDEAAEVGRILHGRPPVVITSDRRRTIWNVQSRRVLDPELKRNYRLEMVVPRGKWHTLVYVRRDLSPA